MTKLRSDILWKADDLVCEDREQEHGDASIIMERVARLWCAYLDLPEGHITKADACEMMAMLKGARFRTKNTTENAVDGAGYKALAGELGNTQ